MMEATLDRRVGLRSVEGATGSLMDRGVILRIKSVARVLRRMTTCTAATSARCRSEGSRTWRLTSTCTKGISLTNVGSRVVNGSTGRTSAFDTRNFAGSSLAWRGNLRNVQIQRRTMNRWRSTSVSGVREGLTASRA
uniref:(northern house mosquito) hypothetical protein n=1 Tax=Culex pipiens TaxID=7175 RepID=A0A8D8AEQ4_CULPI